MMSKRRMAALFTLIALNAVLIMETDAAGWSVEARLALALVMAVLMLAVVRSEVKL